MKQQTEIFYNESCDDIITAMNNGENIVGLMDELGLKKQKGLYEVDNKPIPYRPMRKDEEFAYGVLCPNESSLEDYDDEVIPIECLKEIKRAKDSGYFKEINILYAEHAQVKDPVVIGLKQNGEYSWNVTKYIIARWGEELLPIEVLLPDAIAKYKAILSTEMKKIQHNVDQYIKEFEEINEHNLPDRVRLQPCFSK